MTIDLDLDIDVDVDVYYILVLYTMTCYYVTRLLLSLMVWASFPGPSSYNLAKAMSKTFRSQDSHIDSPGMSSNQTAAKR